VGEPKEEAFPVDTLVLARISGAGIAALAAGGFFVLIMAFLLLGGDPKRQK
jgi:hypothetical protein